MKKKTKQDKIQQEQRYITFLEKSLASKNFHDKVSPEIVQLTKEKLKKAKLVLRCLKEGK